MDYRLRRERDRVVFFVSCRQAAAVNWSRVHWAKRQADRIHVRASIAEHRNRRPITVPQVGHDLLSLAYGGTVEPVEGGVDRLAVRIVRGMTRSVPECCAHDGLHPRIGRHN